MQKAFIWVVIIPIFLLACSTDEKVFRLLRSKNQNETFKGIHLASKKKDIKFVPLLLENAKDERMSSQLGYKGQTIYAAKMKALAIIFDQRPPHEISNIPDTAIINFYERLYIHSKGGGLAE